MTVTQPYAGLPPQLQIRITLYYISQNIAADPELGDYIYDLPNPWDNSSESHFDNLVWNDTRPKPTWANILSYYTDAWNSYYPSIPGMTRNDVNWLRTNYLDQYIEEALEPNVIECQDDIEALETGKVPASRTLAGLDLSANRSASALRGAIMSTQSHINDAATNSPTDAATNGPTNAPTDAPTNYGVLAAVLGGEVNSNNAKQNATAANVNTLAGIVNANAAKQNTIATNLNSFATKFNSWLDAAEANNLLAA